MVTRAEAIKSGLVTYDAGRRCRHEHAAVRYTSSGTCVACHKAGKISILKSMSDTRYKTAMSAAERYTQATMPDDKRLVLAYLAGIVDGEGCVFIQKKHVLTLTIGMRDREAIDLFSSYFGIVGRTRTKDKKGGIHHVWCVTHRRAFTALKELLPYMRVKRRQAELALEFYERCFTWATQ